MKFEPGSNFIVGDINQNVRSNATGKSSALMAVSFAMFGKIQKNVVKGDIVNWQNKKGCEVHLLFYRKGDKILIKRGIKPNFIKIYINDESIPQESDLRVAQQKLEDEIIGWNLDMFNNLIYCNPNNTISILDTTAAKKRQFIENLFSDIEYFSDLMEKTKEKLKNIKKSINDNNIKIEFYDNNINDLQNEINDLQNSDVFDVQSKFKEYRELRDEYDKLYEENEGIEEEIKRLEKDLKIKKDEIAEKEKELTNVNNEIYRIENIDLANLKNELEKSEKNETYKRKLKEIDEYLAENEDIEKKKQDIESNLKECRRKITEKEQELSKYIANIENFQEQYKSLYPDYNLKNKVICPTCGNNINYEKTKEHFKEERKKISKKTKELEKSRDDISNDVEESKEEKKKIQEELDSVNEVYQTVLNYKEQK
ncbi:MAG: AAA family ATPase, partial [archaeon]